MQRKKRALGHMLYSVFMTVCLTVSLLLIPSVISAADNPLTVVDVSAGSSHTLAIMSDGSLWGWGSNFYGQIGLGESGRESEYLTPVKIMDDVAQVAAGRFFSMAIKKDGSLWAWGFNPFGQLGGGLKQTPDTTTPIKVMDKVKSVAAGHGHTLAVKTDGSLWAWGSNSRGQIGNGNGTVGGCQYDPVKIMDGVTAISASRETSMAVKTDGSLWAWGDNQGGGLGDGTKKDRHKPVKIMDGVVAVSNGTNNSAAIKSDGSLWYWGVELAKKPPVKVMDNVVAVEAGWYTMAVQADGSLWAWGMSGSNFHGSHGDGTTNDHFYTNPVKVMTGVKDVKTSVTVSMGGSMTSPVDVFTMALKTDGTLWGWGQNSYGAVGNGKKGPDVLRPVQVEFTKPSVQNPDPTPDPSNPNTPSDPNVPTNPDDSTNPIKQQLADIMKKFLEQFSLGKSS